MNIIGPSLEKRFIYDCYACREGKGTHFGIARLKKAVAACPDGWVLKMDISSFFMSIDKNLLWRMLKDYLQKNLGNPREEIILYLLEKIIFNDPRVDCKYLCSRDKWNNLPASKSLFNAKDGYGLPIGNLTSQVFANFYMSELDHYVKHDLGIRYYGRYVDDFYLVHNNKDYLLACRNKISSFVESKLKLRVNTRKTYLQRVDKGVKFLGVKIELGHINAGQRTISNFKNVVSSINEENAKHRLTNSEMRILRSKVNSYLGILAHFDTYRIRKDIISSFEERLRNRFVTVGAIKSIKLD